MAQSCKSWGEHEIDHILLIDGDYDTNINQNEVSEVRYVTLDEMRLILRDDNMLLTPWFRAIATDGYLMSWWSELLKNGLEEPSNGPKDIIRMGLLV